MTLDFGLSGCSAESHSPLRTSDYIWIICQGLVRHYLYAYSREIVDTYLINLTAKPKSAMQQAPFFLTKIFLLLISLWAIAGFPKRTKTRRVNNTLLGQK